MMTDRQLMTHRECLSSLNCDDRHGLIYGPYAIKLDTGLRFLSRLEWAGHTNSCIYCGDELPRGRQERIAQRLGLELKPAEDS